MPDFILSSQQGDTAAVCTRNSISDVTLYDSTNILTKLSRHPSQGFPFRFVEKSAASEARAKEILISKLREGEPLPAKPAHDDWITGVLFLCLLIFAFIRQASKTAFPGAARFFLFKGLSETGPHEQPETFSGLIQLLNLISILVTGLFVYIAASIYGIIPSAIPGILFWLVCVGALIVIVLLRYLISVLTGFISGESAIFREYASTISMFYRFSSLFLFVLVIMICYTDFAPAGYYLIAGSVAFGIMYIFRIFRLFIIFQNRSISIFYLILYLCALEILPVLISVKYFTGLV